MASPAAGEVVTKHLDSIVLTFGEELLSLDPSAGGFAIQVTDADGGHHESGCVRVDGSVMSTDVALGEAGDYEVVWQAASADGHPVSGSYTFTWKPNSVTVAAPAFGSAPGCDDPWSGAPSTSSPSAAQTVTPGPASSNGAAGVSSGSAAPTPEPTMTVLGVVPADASKQSSIALPLSIVLGIGGLAGVSAVLVYVFRRKRRDDRADDS
ncbi:hypothetical protein BH09ACT6_BH09ACT6_21180 [soil metagenome]